MNYLEKQEVALYDINKILQCIHIGSFRSAWKYCWHLTAFVYYCAIEEKNNDPFVIPYDPQS